jgi:hypothetical protein
MNADTYYQIQISMIQICFKETFYLYRYML